MADTDRWPNRRRAPKGAGSFPGRVGFLRLRSCCPLPQRGAVLGVLCALLLSTLAGANPAKAEDNTLTFGAVLSLSGKYSASGHHLENGYRFAIAAVNEGGGLRIGRKVYRLTLHVQDDESSPALAAEHAREMVRQKGLNYLLGPFSAGLTEAVAEIAAGKGVPLVSATLGDDRILEKQYKGLFTVAPPESRRFASILGLARDHKSQILDKEEDRPLRLAIAWRQDPLSRRQAEAALAQAKERGIEAVFERELPFHMVDLRPLLKGLGSAKADVLLLVIAPEDAAQTLRQAKILRGSSALIALAECGASRLVGLGAVAEGVLCPGLWDPRLGYSDDVLGTATDYVAAFERRYSYRPPALAVQASAAVLTYLDAFRRTASLKPDAVISALRNTDFQSVYGSIRFDDKGRNVGKSLVIFQVQEGKSEPIGPEPWVQGRLTLLPQQED